jgi:hemerythrin
MEQLKWSPTYETGVAEIDQDHRRLFALADAIYDGVSKRDPTVTAKQVQGFIDACKTHFAWEENVLARAGFPGLEGHKVYHTSLLAKADELRKVCDVETDFAKAHACYEEVIAFLIDDVLRGDVEFNSYLDYFGVRQKV